MLNQIHQIPDLSAYDIIIQLRQKDSSMLNVDDTVKVYPTIEPTKLLQARVKEKKQFGVSYNERLGLKDPYGSFKEIEFRLEIIGDTQNIRPGNTAKVEISLILKKEVILVPLAFLEETKFGYQVYLDENKNKTKEIKIGKMTTSHAEVISGLTTNSKIFM